MLSPRTLRMDHANKEIKIQVVTSPRACKICGEVGHTSKEHQDQCPFCDHNHPVGECPTSQVTCYLCEGTNHIPAKCHLDFIVQQVKEQVKDGMYQALGKKEENLSHITCSKCKKEGHNINECPEKEVQENHNNTSRKSTRDMTKVFCHRCRKIGHFTDDCRTRKRAPTDVIIVRTMRH